MTRSDRLPPIEGEAAVYQALSRKMLEVGGMRRLAKELDVSPAMLSRVLRGEAQITASMARAVGWKKVIRFEQVEI